MAAALFTATASAANGDVTDDGWLMVEDFENSPTISTFNYVGDTPTGTATVIDNTTSTGGKVASFVGGDYNTVIELSVKLPEGEVLKNYSQIAFDLYRNSGDENYKKMLVQADDYRIYMDEGEDNFPQQAPSETWTEMAYSIDLTNTVGNEFKLRIGILSDAADYLIDNVRLKVISEEDMPGTSQNGAVTGGWLMAEDFEGYLMGAKLNVYPIKYDAKGTADIAKAPTDDMGRSAHFTSTDWNNIIEVPITLPAGKVLANYSEISFDLYINEGSSANRQIHIYADDETILAQEGYPTQGNTGQWLSKSFDIPGGLAAGNEFNLRIGMSVNAGEEYYIDNIRLKESSEPVAPGTTQNGQIVDGWLMLQDFEAASLNDDFRIWNRWGKDLSDIYEVSLVDNPDGGKAAKITYPDEGQKEYDTMFELDVTLPAGKELTDYSEIAFDFYRLEGDHTGTQVYIDVNGVLIYLDSGFPDYDEADGKWATKKCELEPIPNGDEPAGSIDGITGSFKLHLGLKSPGPNYMIDNVRLKPTTATGITDVQAGAETVVVVDGGVMINAGAKAAYAVYDISGRAVSQGVADGSKTVTLQRGVYVVRVNGKAVKVLVR